MARYILRRLILLLPVMFGVSIVIFVIMRSLPGDPAVAILGPGANPESIALLREELSLDEPIPVQYVTYVTNIATGNFGTSYSRNQDVMVLVGSAWPYTAALAVASILVTCVIGLPLGAALILGAVLAPTDPVLAGDIGVGPPGDEREHEPNFSVTGEAGLNDGAAFPFVYLAMAIATAGGVTGTLLFDWLWQDVAYRITVGLIGGIALGWLLGKILFSWPRENALASTESALIAFFGVLVVYEPVNARTGPFGAGSISFSTRRVEYPIRAGIGYRFADESVSLLGGSCDFTPFRSTPTSRGSGGGLSLPVAKGTKAVSLRIKGSEARHAS